MPASTLRCALGFVLLASSSLLGGCGGRVDDATTSAPVGAATPVGSGAPVGAATPASIGCGVTNDRASFTFELASGQTLSCGNPASTGEPATVTGAITDVSLDAFSLDTCPPTADCATSAKATFHVRAPGLDLRTALTTGTYVEVTYQLYRSWDCVGSLHVASVASWGGVPNPVPPRGVTTSLPLLDVTDGTAPLRPEYALGYLALGCSTSGDTGCGAPRRPDTYAFQFTPTEGGAATTVGMGQTLALALSRDPTLAWSVRDLRSYQGTACDAYWDWAYWVAFQAK
jgi:hypothetical protein